MIGEVHDNLLQFFRLHLSVTNGHPCVGDVLVYYLGYACKVFNTVVYEIHLTVAAHLEVYGIGNDVGTESVNLCLYRVAVGRRCLYYAQVACSYQ